jgi:maltose alpha-D-glucosyltransferase/alpha-amylase
VIARLKVQSTGRNGERDAEGILYDPLESRDFTRALLTAIARRSRYKGSDAEVLGTQLHTFRQVQGDSEDFPEPSLLPSSRKNTALIALGDRWVLNIFRRLEEGMNPEFQVGRFLTEKTSFRNLAPVAGAIEYRCRDVKPMTLALLEGFVTNEGNAWQYTQDALGRYFERVLTLAAHQQDLPVPHKSLLELVEEEVPLLMQETTEGYLGAAQLLGQRSGELHVALASAHNDPEFIPEPFTPLHQRSIYQSVRTQARQTLELLRKRVRDLPQQVRETANRVLSVENEVLKRLQRMLEQKLTAPRIRCHGDYTLTQVLYTGKDFVIINLEGDPNRHFSDRRRKRTPLRDVATMLRSFHYAALIAWTTGNVRSEDVPTLQPWVGLWNLWVGVAFLKGYLPIAEPHALVPSSRTDQSLLLDFYLLKRALNEVRYELQNHPDRVHVPLLGLTYLLETKG